MEGNVLATNIGHSSDSDLIALSNGVVSVNGELSATTLDINGTNITATAAEINLIDGNSSIGTTTVSDGHGLIFNHGGTMAQTTVETLANYLDDKITAMPNLTSIGTLTSLSVDNINIDGNTIVSNNTDGDVSLTPNGTGQVNINISGGTIGGVTIGSPGNAAAGTFAALIGTSLDLSDGNITNVGDINCDSISIDELKLTFY